MSTSEEQIREIVIRGIQTLGSSATGDELRRFVEQELQSGGTTAPAMSKGGERLILTAFGMNHPGVVSSISTLLSEKKCDILDLSQKIMQEFFTMIMLVDISGALVNIRELQDEMNAIAERLKIKIYLQHEDVFRHMHRI